jgi:hypothetical protein
MRKFKVDISEGRFKMHGHVQEIGEDFLVSIWGGTKPHIGAVGMATPRASLKDPNRWSATSSNFTFIGHKEDLLVKQMSEGLAAQLKRNVVVVAGIHWDGVTASEIEVIQNLVGKMSAQILRRLK